MRSVTSIAALSALAVASTSAFTSRHHAPVPVRALYSSSKTTVCDIPEFAESVPTLTNSAPIKSAVVTNAEGDFIRIDDVIKGNNPHVVIFLRHMG